ncbi:hypothetical protein PEBR_22414 [Penicillium brasilianum]|uniref:Uncharacterized protein n=1 Tax=Penicillium brasilianum TaxID=104259 RepID=A0A1S9RMI1_PENBI|nr:hypothetical protein PEBR_22414 [Penicillium brasilianum]
MRNTLLIALLAVGALGIPNVPDYIKAEKDDLWVCDDNMNKKGWDKLHMDDWVELFGNAWPHSLGGRDADKSKPYIRYVADQTRNYGSIDCEIGITYSCDITANRHDCRAKGNGITPVAYFHLMAMKRFSYFAQSLGDAIDSAGSTVISNAASIAAKFTDHDISKDDPSSAFSIAGGVFGILGGIPGIGTFANAAGGLGGVLSLEGTIMAPAQSAAALIVQKEVHDIAKLQASLEKIKDNARDAVWKWANQIINDPLTKRPIDESNGWMKLLKGGAFADNIQQNWRKNFQNLHSITKQFNVFAISGSWQLDQIFVVKAKNINGDLTKDYSKAKLDQFDGVCEDGDCYFFVRAQSFQNLLDGKWQTVKGLDSLKDYGLKPIDMAKGAEWYKKINGGDITTQPADLLKTLQNQKKSAGKLWVSLPFIDYDEDVKSTSKIYHEGSGAPSDHSHFISTLANHIPDVKNWPYDNDLSTK